MDALRKSLVGIALGLSAAHCQTMPAQLPKFDYHLKFAPDDPLSLAREFMPRLKLRWMDETSYFDSFSGCNFYERGRFSIGAGEYNRNRYRSPGEKKVSIPKQPYRVLEGPGGKPRQYDAFIVRFSYEFGRK